MARNPMAKINDLIDEAQESIDVAWRLSQDVIGYEDSDITGYVDIGVDKLKVARKKMKSMDAWMRYTYASIEKWEKEARLAMKEVERRRR